MAGFYGVTAKLGWGAALPVTDALEFQRDTVRCYETLEDFQGISGKRGHKSNRKQVTRRDINGEVECIPNAIEWSFILPRALGAPAAGTTYALAETLPEFYHVADRGLVHTFTGMKVNTLTLNARERGGLQAVVALIGKDETLPVGLAGTFPVGCVINETTQSFSLPQGAVSIKGNAYQVDGVQCVLNNFLVARFGNSFTATEIAPTDRVFSFSCRIPWGEATALYTAGATEGPIVVTFTNGSVSLQVSMPSARWPKQTAPVENKEEEWYSIEAIAGIDGAGLPEVSFTLDSTP